ncbi:MAG: N-acetylmuramoyl-L-alanine amidase [Candidatus Cloacimonetes bacterium]|nr:N-acetylmuramoyl-L-alanine amidase [Candidatus Cloacimonadota bacterium]
MAYTNSPLVSYTKLSPNHSGQRTHSIDRITPHCVVGQCSIETLGNIMYPTSRQASCNYGIGPDGRVGMYVEEKNRSWCSSSNANDQRAITIECASDTFHPYAMNDKVYATLITLCTDICRRNGKKKLLWFADKNKSLNYIPAADEMVLTVHRWFANKSCPGDWLYSRLGDVAAKVTANLSSTASTTTPSTSKTTEEVAKEVIAGKWGNGEDRKQRLTAAGYNYSLIQAKVNELMGAKTTVSSKSIDELAREVIQGKWGNGEERKNRLISAGYDYSAVQAKVNELMGGIKSTKSVDQLAREVIYGYWGNGQDRKNRLTAAGYDYSAVQNRVNELLK